jgi:YD repeat-containing protein
VPSPELNCYLNQFLVHVVTNPEGNSTMFDYDDTGNLKFVTDVLGRVTEFHYNPDGTLDFVKRLRGQTSFAYGENLTNITVTDPLMRMSKTTYDSVGRPVERTSAAGKTTKYKWGSLNRLENVAYQDGTSVTFGYDANGNVTSQTDSTGTTTFEYDHRNRQNKKILPSSGTIIYNYDEVGNLTSKTDAGGPVGYTYDNVDRLKTLTEPDNSIVTYEDYDANDNPLTVIYPTGMTINREWDGAGRVTRIKATALGSDPRPSETTLVDLKYEYAFVRPGESSPVESTLLHRLTDIDGIITDYSYDELNQLTAETRQTVAGRRSKLAWEYDVNGNRERQIRDSPPRGSVTFYEYNLSRGQ